MPPIDNKKQRQSNAKPNPEDISGSRSNSGGTISQTQLNQQTPQQSQPPTPAQAPSPLMKPKSSTKLKKYRSKPHLKRSSSGHSKFLFSVDDDVYDDFDNDPHSGTNENFTKPKFDREYFEGYNDALKALYNKKSKKDLKKDSHGGSYFPEVSRIEETDHSNAQEETEAKSPSSNQEPIESAIKKHLVSAEESLRLLENLDRENSPGAVVSTPLIDEELEAAEGGEDDDDDDNESDDGSVKSSSSSKSLESLNLRERQDAINSTHPFGIKIWKPSLYKKKRSVAARAEEDIHDYSERRPSHIFWGVYVTNALWFFSFGLMLYIVCLFCSLILFVVSGFGIKRSLRNYIKLVYKVGRYWLYPFGKFVLLTKDENYLEEDEMFGSSINEFHRWRSEEEGRLFFAPPRRYTGSNNESRPLLKDHKGRALRDAYSFLSGDNSNDVNANDDATDDSNADEDPQNSRIDIKVRFFGRGNWTWSRIIFYLIFYLVLQPIFYLVGFICWMCVFSIPMSNITTTLCDHLRRHPLALHFESEKSYYSAAETEAGQRKRKDQLLLLCTYRCMGFHYYKYTIDGTNVFFINLLAAVIFVIFDHYVLLETLKIDAFFTSPTFIFCGGLFSTIPLAFFLGQAVASISAQSSMGVGAVTNAFFSTVVEIFLYCVALTQSKGKLVEGSMIGSVLAGVLLLPGLSMCGGAFKRKTQRYNPRSAGVSSTMLLFGMVIMFAPSLFYQIYGSYEIKCKKCETTQSVGFQDDCTTCRFIQPVFSLDELYFNVIKPFSLFVAVALLLAYACGLIFTLRTHASLIWATSSAEHHTHKKDDNASLRSPSIVSLDGGRAMPIKSQGNAAYTSGADANRKSNPQSMVSSALPSPSIDVTKQRLPKNALQQMQQSQSQSQSQSQPPQQAQQQAQPKGTPFKKTPTSSEVHTPLRRSSAAPVTNKETEPEEEMGGHDAPNWSRTKSCIILIGATVLYAVIAEILVDVVDEVLKDYPINPKFLGLTVFALVPNTTEFINAISFAIGGNVALSMEIGSAYALQVVLIQIPILCIYSILRGFELTEQIFSLVFPRWDIIATLISIYLFTYIYAEGKSNYFKGVILILTYVVVLIGFWLNDTIEDLNDGYGAPINPPYSF